MFVKWSSMGRESIGEFEQLVMLAILRIGEDASANSIIEEIRSETGRRVLRPAVYVALRRLEEKGMVSSSDSEGTAERGGRKRREFRVEGEGLQRLRDSRRALLRMWDGVQAVLDR